MKKILSLIIIGLLCFSMFSTVVCHVEAQETLTPKVYVLENCDPDYENPPSDDKLTIVDPSDHTKVNTISEFNICETIGAWRVIAASDDGKSIVIVELVNERLLKYDASGNRLFSRNIDGIECVDISEDENIYALAGTGISGERTLLLDSSGYPIQQAPFGGIDIAVDDRSNSVWIVGVNIKRLDKDLTEYFTIDPIVWAAVSVDFASNGDAWVAERQHHQVEGSKDRLLKISKNGDIIKTIDLATSPFCVSVDRSDNSFWVASWDGLHKRDENGDMLMQVELTRRWSVKVNQYDGSVWVAGYGDVKHYTKNGELISPVSGFSDSQAYVAFDSYPSPEPDFEISVAPDSQKIRPDEYTCYTVTVTSIDGFSSPVELRMSLEPETSEIIPFFDGVYEVGTVTPPSNGEVQAELKIIPTYDVIPYTYTLTITGTSGEKVHSDLTTLKIEPRVVEISPDLCAEVAGARSKLYETMANKYEYDLWLAKHLVLEVVKTAIIGVFEATIVELFPGTALAFELKSLLSDANLFKDSLDLEFKPVSIYTLRAFDSESEYSTPAVQPSDYPDEFIDFLWENYKLLYDLRTITGELDADCLSIELIYMSWLSSNEKDAWEENNIDEAREILSKEHTFLEDHLAKWLPIFNNKVQNDMLPTTVIIDDAYKELLGIIVDTVADDKTYIETLVDPYTILVATESGEIGQDEILSWSMQVAPDVEGIMIRTLWGGSDIDSWLIDSEGKRYDGMQMDTTLEEILILNPVTGYWELFLLGKNVPTGIESFTWGVFEITLAGEPYVVEELEHLKEFIDELPDDSLDQPKLASQRKNSLLNKIDAVILKVEAGNYTDAINKLRHDIRAKMDGDSTAEDWIICQTTELCVIINHIISSIEIVQQT